MGKDSNLEELHVSFNCPGFSKYFPEFAGLK